MTRPSGRGGPGTGRSGSGRPSPTATLPTLVAVLPILLLGGWGETVGQELDAGRFRTGEFEYVLVADEVEYGEYKLKLEEDGDEYRMEEELDSPLGEQDTKYVFRRDMSPLEAERSGSLELELEYGERQVRGTATRVTEDGDTETEEVERALEPGTLDEGMVTAIVLASPLGDGFELELPVFHPEAGVATMSARVTGTDSVRVPAGSYRVYRVVVAVPRGGENVLFVTVEPPRMLVMQELRSRAVVFLLKEVDD